MRLDHLKWTRGGEISQWKQHAEIGDRMKRMIILEIHNAVKQPRKLASYFVNCAFTLILAVRKVLLQYRFPFFLKFILIKETSSIFACFCLWPYFSISACSFLGVSSSEIHLPFLEEGKWKNLKWSSSFDHLEAILIMNYLECSALDNN